MKKRLMKLLLFVMVLILSGCTLKMKDKKITIISSSFPGYDFARAITKNNSEIEVKMLIQPGMEMHDFEPTPKDIMNIENSAMFIYVGGESDAWIDNLLSDLKAKTKVVRLMDYVSLMEEEIVPGMETEEEEEETEYDEHIWTSPKKAEIILEKLFQDIQAIDSMKNYDFRKNVFDYEQQLQELDTKFTNMINASKRKEIVFGDRFPFLYFTRDYGLSYTAAFPGCSDATEASAKTISYLIDKVKSNHIPVVFHLELSNGNIAKTIAKETGAKVLEFHSLHNISQTDFDLGLTYIDIMQRNYDNLKEALNE